MEEISTRGRLQDALTTKQVLLIGAGALGSTLADMLVRGGVTRMTVVDPDHLEMGNLVRHTLHTSDLRQRKAAALAEALNHTSPHASVTPLVMEFPPGTDDAIAAVQQTDIVIDTTGNDGVLHHLEAFPWGSPKLFVSIALGLKGQRLYCYAAHDDTFPVDDFRTRINPLLSADIEKMKQAGESLPREGIGCWHPVFPVRVDDVRLLAAAAIKFLEPLASVSPEQPLLSVFEQTVKDGQFTGIQRIAA
jgi:threonine dehydrogenase-like Zn-dependent dehydrogenase